MINIMGYSGYNYSLQQDIREEFRNLLQQYRPLKDTTSNYVWGKEVRIYYSDQEGTKEYKTELGTWMFSWEIKDNPFSYEVPQLVRQVRRKEVAEALKSKAINPCICQLMDWDFLTDDKDRIFKYDEIKKTWIATLVKYAVVVDQNIVGKLV